MQFIVVVNIPAFQSVLPELCSDALATKMKKAKHVKRVLSRDFQEICRAPHVVCDTKRYELLPK